MKLLTKGQKRRFAKNQIAWDKEQMSLKNSRKAPGYIRHILFI